MKPKKDRVFNVVTINDVHDGLDVKAMAEPELLAWIASHDMDNVRIFDGTEFKPNTQITLEPVAAPAQQPTDKPKRKYTRKAKAEALKRGPNDGDGPKVGDVLDGKNGAGREQQA